MIFAFINHGIEMIASKSSLVLSQGNSLSNNGSYVESSNNELLLSDSLSINNRNISSYSDHRQSANSI